MSVPDRRPGSCPLQTLTALVRRLIPGKGTTAAHDEIFPEDVAAWLERGARLIDVRSQREFKAGHIPSSVNLPLQDLTARFAADGKPVVLICASGNRSGFAAKMLKKQGVIEVANLLGGVTAWARAGQPLENGRNK